MYLSLTHWGRLTHICVSNLTIIGSDNGLSPGWRQAIIWTNDGQLLIGPLRTNFSEILIEILTFSYKKMHLNVSSGKWWPFCLGLNELIWSLTMCDLCGLEQFEAAVVLSFHYYILRVLPTLIVACIMVCTVIISLLYPPCSSHTYCSMYHGMYCVIISLLYPPCSSHNYCSMYHGMYCVIISLLYPPCSSHNYCSMYHGMYCVIISLLYPPCSSHNYCSMYHGMYCVIISLLYPPCSSHTYCSMYHGIYCVIISLLYPPCSSHTYCSMYHGIYCHDLN